MNRSQTLLGLSQIYEYAGYEVESMGLRRCLLGWSHSACLLNPNKPYKTTTGESCRYGSGPRWALTKLGLCHKVQDVFTYASACLDGPEPLTDTGREG